MIMAKTTLMIMLNLIQFILIKNIVIQTRLLVLMILVPLIIR